MGLLYADAKEHFLLAKTILTATKKKKKIIYKSQNCYSLDSYLLDLYQLGIKVVK